MLAKGCEIDVVNNLSRYNIFLVENVVQVIFAFFIKNIKKEMDFFTAAVMAANIRVNTSVGNDINEGSVPSGEIESSSCFCARWLMLNGTESFSLFVLLITSF